jgi:NAD(P)-dependent dehydrogenase (short-subunit alcohol dehydrogenase family)
MRELRDRVAVITGGGSGIGEAIALACADAGMHVALGDIEEANAAKVAEQVRARGRRALAVKLDVTQPEDLERFAEAVYAELGACHLLCNNAGVLVMGMTHERSIHDWDWVLAVNVKGVAFGIRAFVPRMLAQGGEGHIVNTSSSNGLFALPRHGVYTAAKFAVLGLSEALRFDLAPHQIGVSVVCPGGVKTKILHSQRNRPSDLGSSKTHRDDVMAIMAASDAANNTLIDAERVAQLVLEAVRNNEPYVITHPGSKATVEKRFKGILEAYDIARKRGPDLP